MNFVREVVEAAPPDQRAMVCIAGSGARREWSMDDVARGSGTVAAHLHERGLRKGDVVLTLLGNRPEWVLTMTACFRQGYVVMPCTEQLRAKDLRLRLDVAQPRMVLADERNAGALRGAGWDGPTIWAPWGEWQERDAPPPGELVWCTAASGWSKSARNAFIAPWLRGAAGLLHDARFDPDERLELIARERVGVLCMAPTEYRVIAKRAEPRPAPALRGLVAAGEPLDPEVLRAWHEPTGLWIRDGYGQTETGQLTGMPLDEPARAGSMGRALPGVRLEVDAHGELVL